MRGRSPRFQTGGGGSVGAQNGITVVVSRDNNGGRRREVGELVTKEARKEMKHEGRKGRLLERKGRKAQWGG
jgi:hypothetical protein